MDVTLMSTTEEVVTKMLKQDKQLLMNILIMNLLIVSLSIMILHQV